jgi:DNA-binding transcriptional LysR family regulator
MPTIPPDDLVAVPAGAWSALELRHLHALLAVADEGTFSRAAARLGYTQSAVSQQIGALERMVGAPLFDRPGGPRPVELTEAGHALVGHARGVLSRLGAAQAELAAISAGERGRIRVGTVQSVGTQVLPGLLSKFRDQRPGVEIVLRESHDVHVLMRAVAEGELDVTFTEVDADPRFHYRHMLDDPFVFVAPRESAEAARASIALDELTDLPMIGYRDVVCRTIVEQVFNGDAMPTVVFRSDDNPTIQGCVASGIGYWVTAALTVDIDDPAIAVVPIVPAPEPRHISLAWPADRRTSPAVAEFVDVAEAVCRGVEERMTTALRRPVRRPTTAA